MRFGLAFCILLFSLSLAFASCIEEPQRVVGVKAVVFEDGTIEAVGGDMSDLDLNVSVPQNTGWQRAVYSVPVEIDALGNAGARVREPAPSNPFKYNISTSVFVEGRATGYLPGSYSIPASYSKLLSQTDSIKFDSDLKELALSIVNGSEDDFERVSRLAAWVHAFVLYDESVAGQLKDSQWVLNNRRGVCTEYTRLFSALARSIGIPTRTVTGYAYSDFGAWLGHSWAEVFIGEWVPVDPTWLEVGHLDATHIRVLSSNDELMGNNLTVFVTEGSVIEWTSDVEVGGRALNILLQECNSSDPIPFVLGRGAGIVEFGGSTVVWVELEGFDYRLVPLTLASCVGEYDVMNVDSLQQFAVLRPGRKTVVAWVVEASSRLPSGYSFTCPLTLSSQYTDTESLSVSIDESHAPQEFDAWLARSVVSPGEEVTVFLSAPGLGVVTEEEVAFPQGDSYSFVPKRPGAQLVHVFSPQGGVKSLEFIVSENVSVFIANVSVPEHAAENSDVQVSAVVRVATSTPQAVAVTASVNGYSVSQRATFSGDSQFDFVLDSGAAGNKTVLFELDSALHDSRSVPLHVFGVPVVSVPSFSRMPSGDLVNVTLFFEVEGTPVNPIVSVGSASAPVPISPNSSASFLLEPGNYSVKLSWFDEMGNKYASSVPLTVARGYSSCPFAFILISVLLASAFFFEKG